MTLWKLALNNTQSWNSILPENDTINQFNQDTPHKEHCNSEVQLDVAKILSHLSQRLMEASPGKGTLKLS